MAKDNKKKKATKKASEKKHTAKTTKYQGQKAE